MRKAFGVNVRKPRGCHVWLTRRVSNLLRSADPDAFQRAPLRFRPTIPRIIKANEPIFTAVRGSLNHTMPMLAIKAVPTPDQTAETRPTSRRLRTNERTRKLTA